MSEKPSIAITGVWLRSVGDRMLVDIEIGGMWLNVIDEYAPLNEMTISHAVSAHGIEAARGRENERRMMVYTRDECPFQYCDSPVVCKIQLHEVCRHRQYSDKPKAPAPKD